MIFWHFHYFDVVDKFQLITTIYSDVLKEDNSLAKYSAG